MEKEIEIKASNEKEVIDIIKEKYGNEYDYEITEIKKSKSILGFINTNGSYKVLLKEKKKTADNIIREKIEKLIELMDLELKFDIKDKGSNKYIIDFNGKDNGILIGKKGKTLNSFEFLVASLFEEYKIEVDVEGFKLKREQTLKELARKMVEKVQETEKAVKLNPMPPRERKIIHEVVNTYEGIDTYSEGKDPKRYIVIRKKR